MFPWGWALSYNFPTTSEKSYESGGALPHSRLVARQLKSIFLFDLLYRPVGNFRRRHRRAAALSAGNAVGKSLLDRRLGRRLHLLPREARLFGRFGWGAGHGVALFPVQREPSLTTLKNETEKLADDSTD